MVTVAIIAVPSSPTVGNEERRSTLVLEDNGAIRVMGVLPHGYTFRPETREDAIKLAAHVRSYFDDGQCG